MPAVDAPATLVAVAAGTFVFVHLAFRSLWARRAMVGIPTSAAAGVHIGLNRVHGVARPLTEARVAPLTGVECAGWSYHVEDERRRESLIRWRRQRQWRAVVDRSDAGDFDLVDESGSVRVRLAGASIVGQRTHHRVLRRSDPEYLELAPPGDQRGATGRRRVTELVIPLDRPTTVVGSARLRADAPRPELGWEPEDRTLLVSSVAVAVHTGRKIAAAAAYFVAAAAVLAMGPLGIRPSDTEYWQAVRESGRWVPVLLAGTALVVALQWLRYLHNDMVGLRERVERARSLVAVEVQRRHDLLPSLAHAAAGAAHHEQETFLSIAGTRASESRHVTADDDITTVSRVDREDTTAVRRIAVVAEAHPELLSNENFRHVQNAIIDAEDRLALGRSFYNDSVTLYNNRRAVLPASLVAGLLGFRPATLYASSEGSGSDGS